MRLTHLGHACLLVETAGQQLLIDPGEYSAGFTRLHDLAAILLTHQHADHVDPERIGDVVANNPDAVVIAEPETAALLREHGGREWPVMPLRGGEETAVGPVRLLGVGDRHAFNHDGVPRCGNTGFVVTADGEPTLLHPGDAYDARPEVSVDVLAVPLSAPWAAVRDTLEFVSRISPRYAVPVHDALLNDTGRGLYLTHVERFVPSATTVQDLSGGLPWDVPAR
jgi:L-ascorbate metabolism protein UlaG (beta-lactamase superfamily)